MSRFTEIEHWYDDHTLFVGMVALQPDGQIEFDSFHVIVYIGGFDHDVTKAFEGTTQLDRYMQHFELVVVDKYMDDLKMKRGDEESLEEGA